VGSQSGVKASRKIEIQLNNITKRQPNSPAKKATSRMRAIQVNRNKSMATRNGQATKVCSSAAFKANQNTQCQNHLVLAHSRLRFCNSNNEVFAIAFDDSFLEHCRLIPWGLVRFTPASYRKRDFAGSTEDPSGVTSANRLLILIRSRFGHVAGSWTRFSRLAPQHEQSGPMERVSHRRQGWDNQ
jgi:hypothetical protein